VTADGLAAFAATPGFPGALPALSERARKTASRVSGLVSARNFLNSCGGSKPMVIEQSPQETIAPRRSPLETAVGEARANSRWLALLLGGGLLLGACSRRSLPLALLGGMFVYRGCAGRWAFSRWLGFAGTEELPHPATSVPHQTGIREERAIIINRTPEELYRYWRTLENLPRFMTQHLSVERIDDKRSRWKVETVAGAALQWNAEIINDVPNELLAWRSLPGADVDHAGSVHFESAAHGGTKVTVIMEYRAPAGRLGAEVAGLFGQKPGQLVDKSLQRLKQLMETGQVSAVAGQPQSGS
jgi:uncharacterized membrane protein